jgi:murein DD-endopeptidase MepM/ murein hydrolase activator NlpD
VPKFNSTYRSFLILFLGIFIAACDSPTTNEQSEGGGNDTIIEPKTVYGLEADSFLIVSGKVGKNQSLGHILQEYNVGHTSIHRLAMAADTVFDVRHIRAGKPFTVFCTKDSGQVAKCFVYESSASNYVVFDMRDTMRVYKGQKPIEVVRRTVEGTIESSLYNAITDAGANPALAVELSEVYAWTIDFYRIQKGDAFKVMFEENQVEGQTIGIKQIMAADFVHYKKHNYAYHYVSEAVDGYYDEAGENLKKAFLQAPLKFSRISSGFNKKRFHPVLKRVKAHLGTDYAAPTGTPIQAVGDGTISKASYTRGNGNYVKMRHNSVYETQYLHMSKIKSGIKPGVRVKQGDVIGYVGSTGLATGPHVCFRFWKNGEQVDHRREKMPPADPVPSDELESFKAVADSLKLILDSSRPIL